MDDCDIIPDLEFVAGIDIVASRLLVPPLSDALNMRDGDCILVALHDAVKLSEGDSTVSLSWLLIENEGTRVRRLDDVENETVRLPDHDELDKGVIDLEKETVLVMHRVDPFIAAKVAGGHLWQELANEPPELGSNVSGGQGVQATCPGWGLIEPGEQGMQEIGAPCANVPLAH